MTTSADSPARTESHRRRGSLRWRLSVGVLVLVLSVMAIVGAATLFTLRSFLVHQLDTQMTQTAAQVADRPFPDLRGLPEGTLLVEVSPNGSLIQAPILIVGRGRDDENLQLSSTDLRMLQSVGATPVPVSLSELGTYRAVSALDAAGNRTIIASSLESIEDTMRRLLAIEVVALCSAAVLLAMAAYAFIRRELLPLERVATTARRVSHLPLSAKSVRTDERVEIEQAPTEVADVAEAFNEMLDHVDTSLEARDASEQRLRTFVADASHELRTPLVSIRGYAELYRRSDFDSEQRAAVMSRIESEATRMGLLVDDLLLLARLDQGRPLLSEPVDLSLLAAESTADAQVAASDHQLVLDVAPEPVVVRGDPDRLRQVLVNLLANATRHTPAGTRVTVSVTSDEHRGVVTVADNGPGIPPTLQPRVFERFARAEGSRTRATGGTGLGMSIVAAVVAALSGSVDLHSTAEGTTVSVALPLAQSS